MARDPGLRQSLPPIVVGILLLACTVSGLAAGVGTHRLVNSAGFGAISGTRSGTQGNHAASSVSPGSTPAASSSVGSGLPTVTASPPSTGFTLSAQVSPTTVAVGKQFSVTVMVTANDGTTPLEGVRCMLGPPGNSRGSGPSLFAHWPAPVISDSRGEAGWVLQAPRVPVGAYQLVVSGTGTHEYFYYTLVVLTIS